MVTEKETKISVLARITISKLENGEIPFSCHGFETDILGMIEFVKTMLLERIKIKNMPNIIKNAVEEFEKIENESNK